MNLSDINLNLLVSLQALIEEQSVTRAAERLGLSQPAMSNTLARLRRLLDDPVLVRSGNRMVPTPQAMEIYEQIREALRLIEMALMVAQEFDPGSSERIFTVAATDYVGFVLLPRLLSSIKDEAPHVQIEVRPLDGARLAEELEQGPLDLALGYLPAVPPRFRHVALFEERFCCAARQGHPQLKDQAGVSLQTFVEMPHVLVSSPGGTAGVIGDRLAEEGLERRVAVVVPHFLVAPSLAAQSNAVVTLAERVVQVFAEMLPLQTFAPPIDLPGFSVGMLWHQRSDRDPSHRWLREQLQQVSADI